MSDGQTKVGVLGLGLIGGSVMRRLAVAGQPFRILGFDSDPRTRASVVDAGFEVTSSAAELARDTDLILVAVPPSRTADSVVQALEANPHAFVTDVASVKQPIIDDVRQAAPGHLDRYLPSHPLAGAESSGWRSSTAELLASTTWAVCPPRIGAPLEPLAAWADVFDAFEARLVVCEAEEHDAAVARTSHAPHVAAEVIAGSLTSDSLALSAALSGGGFKDVTRIARSDFKMWEEILSMNRVAVSDVLGDWITELEALRFAISSGNYDSVDVAWTRGHRSLQVVDKVRWKAVNWAARSFPKDAGWDALLTLGRDGCAVRRPTLVNGGLQLLVSSATAQGSEPS